VNENFYLMVAEIAEKCGSIE